MRKLVIVALMVISGIVAYLLSRPNIDTSVSIGDNVVGKGKQPDQQRAQGVNSAAGNINSKPELTTKQRQVAAETSAPAEQTPQPAQPGNTSSTTYTTQAPTFDSLGDQQKVERLSRLLSVKGSDAKKYVDVQSIVCEQGVCTVDAVAKSDPGRFRMTMAFLLEQNPWLGGKGQDLDTYGSTGYSDFRIC